MRPACPRCAARSQVTVTAGSKGVRPSGKPPVKHRKEARGSDSPRVSAAAQLAARLQRDATGVRMEDVSRAAGQPAPADELWKLFTAARTVQTPLLDARTCAAVLAACSRGSGWDVRKRVDAVWASAVEAGVSGDAFVRSAYVAALGRVGDVDGAFAAVGGSLADVVTWNALLSATLRAGLFTRGLDTHAAGLAAGLAPDIATHICHVNLLIASGAPRAGSEACEAALLRLAAPDGVKDQGPRAKVAHLLTAGVTAAGRAGDTERAWGLYTRFTGGDAPLVASPDAALFTALIDAAGSDADAAWKAYQEGDARGVKLGGHEPAVCAMLVAFTRARDPSRAWLFFESIRRAWPGRTPPRVAYLLLRDCAAASHDAAWALKVAALMAAELGTSAPPPGDAAPSLRNSSAERAPHARPGVAIARFSVGESSFETRNGDVEATLPDDDAAKRLLSGAGAALVAALGSEYTADTSCVQLMGGGEDAQMQALCEHAEKKALGALLIRAARDGGSTVPRVWVSIRMCRDCHGAFGAASKVFGTRVECLDGHTHIFVDGVCSCGNRWR
jgi:hypothetical protein